MSLNIHGLLAEAQESLLTNDHAESLEEFKRLLQETKEKYLRWNERMPFIEWTYHNVRLQSQETSRAGNMCQSARNVDPLSASNFDPL